MAVVFQSEKLNQREELEVEDREGRHQGGDLFSLYTLIQSFTVRIITKLEKLGKKKN